MTCLPKKPTHGPYAECYWCGLDDKWKLRLNKKGNELVANYIRERPMPVVLLWAMKFPPNAKVLAQRWLKERFAKSEDDMRVLGYDAAVKAALTYDPSRKTMFSTHLSMYVYHAVNNYDMDYCRVKYKDNRVISTDQMGYEDSGWDVLNIGKECNYDRRRIHNSDTIEKVMRELPERYQSIIGNLYLSDDRLVTLKKVGKLHGIGVEMTRRIRDRSFAMIREKFCEEDLL